MLGSSITQALFASANSIAVIPKLWAEWNYNSFVQPHVVTSSSASELRLYTSLYNSPNYWTADSNGSVSWGPASLFLGSSSSTVKFQINEKTSTTSSSTSGNITSKFTAPLTYLTESDVKAGRFYKVIFYIKAYDIGENYSSPTGTNIFNATVSGSGTTSSITYRVAAINSNNMYVQNPLAHMPITVGVSASPTSVKIDWVDWKQPSNSSSYKIYKTIGTQNTTHYLTTVKRNQNSASQSYTDKNPLLYPDTYSPATYTNDIFVCPQVSASNLNGDLIPIDFFVKATDTETGKLSTVEGSVQALSDVWKKVEVWFGTPADSENEMYTISFILNATSEYEKAQFITSNFEMYSVTEYDFYLNEYYPTESVFKPFRPGEALLHPLLPSTDRVIKTDTYSASYIKPASLAIKTPETIFSREIISPEIAMLPSHYDKFTYYISSNKERSIQAKYKQYLSVNKIVLKYINKITSIKNANVIIYANSGSALVTLSTSDFNKNGITTLYYNGSTWSTSSWTSPPTLSSSGTFQNTVNDFYGITFTVPSTAGNIAQTDNSLNVTYADTQRIHMLEISPRLEIDLSPLLIDYSIRTDLTSPNSNGFPLSYINSNSGQVTLSNIPVYQTDTTGATIFENQSTKSAFNNLLRQGVKFYGFLESPSFQPDLTEKVPQYVMYANSWTINDFNNVSVEIFDITKIYNGIESPQFACERSNLFNIITTLLNTAGFSDYDYDDLYNICQASTNTPSFWYDESKSIMENLQDLLISHQISASIDEYGMMRFKSLKQILQQASSLEYTPDFAITDVKRTSFGSSSLTYISNIVPDSYTETAGNKVGKIQIKYTIPKNFDSPDIDEKNQKNFAGQTWFLNSQSSPKIWWEENDVALPNFPLSKTLYAGDNFLSFDPSITFYNPRKNIGQYQGELMIGSEIIGYAGMEYVFFPVGVSKINLTKIITSQSDIARAIEEVKDIYTSSGLQLQQVEYHPTGRLVGLQRGKYGTTPQNHKVFTRNELSYFNKYTYSIHSDSVSSTTTKVSKDGKGLCLSTNVDEQYVMVSPKYEKGYGHNLFSLDFTVNGHLTKRTIYVDKKKKNGDIVRKNGKAVKVRKTVYNDFHNIAVGIFFNLNGTTVSGTSTSNATHFLEIYSTQSGKGQKRVLYYLSLYRIVNNKKAYIIKDIPVSSVFDSESHRLSVYFTGNDMVIAIDNKRIQLLEYKKTQPFYNKKKTSFGAYLQAKDNQAVKMHINELYADTVMPDSTGSKPSVDIYPIENRYYFSSSKFLDNIVRGMSQVKKFYLFQSFPQAYGFKLYDVKHALSPIRPHTAQIIPVRYGSQAVPSKTNEKGAILGPIHSDDLSYSSLHSTPFRSRFAVVNNTNELVVLSSGKDNATHEPLQILANYQLLSEERIIERVVDPNYALTIDLSTSWISSKAEAETISKLLAKSTNTFYTDINVSIFGNPLIQVGDIAQITYGLKRVGYDPANPSFSNTLNCIVTSVTQGFNGSLSDTQLTLKPLIIS